MKPWNGLFRYLILFMINWAYTVGVLKKTNKLRKLQKQKKNINKKHWIEREKPKKLTKKPEKSLSSVWFQKPEIVWDYTGLVWQDLNQLKKVYQYKLNLALKHFFLFPFANSHASLPPLLFHLSPLFSLLFSLFKILA
jgi:hypothetical protein